MKLNICLVQSMFAVKEGIASYHVMEVDHANSLGDYVIVSDPVTVEFRFLTRSSVLEARDRKMIQTRLAKLATLESEIAALKEQK